MNGLLASLNHPVTQRLGWMVLHTVWQGILVGVLFALLRTALPKRSARVHYAVGCLALALLVASPVATLVGTTLPAGTDWAGSLSFLGATSPPIFTPSGVHPGAVTQKLSFFKSSFEALGRTAPLLATVWMAGVGIGAARLSRSFWWLKRLRGRNHGCVEPGWIERLDDLRCRLEVSQPVLLLKSTMVEVPTVIGWLRPVILLPIASVAGLSPDQLDAILAHELAHIRRHDYLVNVFQCVVETLLFYHPVVWWISKCIREDREHCCDDLVVKVCGDRVAYARALAKLEETRAGLAKLAFAANGGSLLGRVRRLLAPPGMEGPAMAEQLGGVALLAVGLILGAGGVYLLTVAPSYQATARVRLALETPGVWRDHDGGVVANFYNPHFLESEIETIRSEAILGKVLETLRLREEWAVRRGNDKPIAKAEALVILRDRITLKPIRNTMFFEIRAIGETPTEAANIANSVAQSYPEHHLEEVAQSGRIAIKGLEDRYEEQAREVRHAQADVDRLGQEVGIYRSSSAEASDIVTADTVRRIETQRIEKETQYRTDETLWSGLSSLSHDQLVGALPTAVPDALLISLQEQMTLAEQRILGLEKDYGPTHPEVVKARSQVNDLKEKINSRVEGIMVGLGQRVSSLKQGLDVLQQKLDEAITKEAARARETRPYFEAKRHLQEITRFSQMLSMKIASEKIEQALPKSVIQIVDSAVPSFRAIGANRPRGMAMLLAGLVVSGAGIGLLRTGRRMTPRAGGQPQPASSAAGQP